MKTYTGICAAANGGAGNGTLKVPMMFYVADAPAIVRHLLGTLPGHRRQCEVARCGIDHKEQGESRSRGCQCCAGIWERHIDNHQDRSIRVITEKDI